MYFDLVYLISGIRWHRIKLLIIICFSIIDDYYNHNIWITSNRLCCDSEFIRIFSFNSVYDIFSNRGDEASRAPISGGSGVRDPWVSHFGEATLLKTLSNQFLYFYRTKDDIRTNKVPTSEFGRLIPKPNLLANINHGPPDIPTP